MEIWIWLAVTVISLVVEFITFDMASIWFAAGGLISLILAACGVGLTWQLIVFIVVALTLLFSLRKIALKYLQKGSVFKSNTDGIIGKTLTLISPIKKNEPGTVKVNGVVWTAITEDNSELEQNEDVVVVNVIGNKIIVKKGDIN